MLVGTLLLFAKIGDRALWQDEAETALLGRSVLEFGVPTAFDGRNLVSQESQAEFRPGDYRWEWTPWLQHYLVAGSFALFGASTTAARLPFAAIGLGCLLLVYFLTLRLTGDRRAARIAALILVLSVPFLLHMRQCRYYAPAAFFSLLVLYQYLQILAGRPRAHWGMALAAVGLFHSHYVIAGALLLSTAVHFALADRRSGALRPLALGWGTAVVLCAPWALVFAAHTAGDALPGLRQGTRSLIIALDHINQYIFPIVLVAPFAFLQPPTTSSIRGGERSELILIPVTLGVCSIALAFVMPYFFFRYYATFIALGAVLQGIAIARVWSWSRALALPLVLLAAGTDLLPRALPFRRELPANDIRYLRTGDEEPGQVVGSWARFMPLAAYLHELSHEVVGPIEAIASTLNELGTPNDTVIATYGDLPLQFYTSMRVVGGLSGVDPRPHLDAEWIVVRAHTHRRADAALKGLLAREVDWSRYEVLTLDVADLPFEHRPAPAYHKFRTVDAGLPQVRIHRRVPRAASAPGGWD
jgi:hypothetical protein